MQRVGGDPSLDFVNTVGGRVAGAGAGYRVLRDRLPGYPELVAFAADTGLVGASAARSLVKRAAARPGEASVILERAVAFREALYRALRELLNGRRPAASDLRRLSREIAASRSREELAATGSGLAWRWRGDSLDLGAPLLRVAGAAAALLTSPERARVGHCSGPECGWLFLDRSRNQSRQWCAMRDCGNVAKVRRFRARRRRRQPAG
jgi:predicted RNA-binding Zn ribbon-like protein